MRKKNVVGSSRGYLERILASYSSVTPEKVRKYYLNSLRFADLYQDGETGYSAIKKMAEIRKSHRGPAQFEIDHSKKAYNRHRI